MTKHTEVTVLDPMCLKAVERYMVVLGREIGLKATPAHVQEDVVFPGFDSEKVIRIAWTLQEVNGSGRRAEWETDDGDEHNQQDRILDCVIQHYSATLRAVAQTPEAARTMLERLEKGASDRRRVPRTHVDS